MGLIVARVAPQGAVYSIDKLYDYELPLGFANCAKRGSRVMVPFGRGDKQVPGFILEISDYSDYARIKKVTYVFKDDIILSDEQISLAIWMRARYFCTFFDAANSFLPPGAWGKLKNNEYSQRINDKMIKNITLEMPYEYAVLQIGKGDIAKKRRAILDCFLDYETISEKELSYLTGESVAVIRTMCKKGILKEMLVHTYRKPTFKTDTEKKDIILTVTQNDAYKKLNTLICGKAQVALLHGITGSGKTEVYLKLIENVLAQNKCAMLLVPEIALTPQMVQRFFTYFKDSVAVLHSMLTDTQRFDEYKRIINGEVRVVIGTRSAVFAPLLNIGIIIIDEEQEYSYKSESNPRYNAVDIAKMRALHHGALIVLGSATPSIESYYNAKMGKYTLVKIESRYGNAPLPDVIVADMRGRVQNGDVPNFSSELLAEIEMNLINKSQTILFINRRGSSGRITCVDCGYTPQCEHCSVSLTYHSRNNRLMCHYCGFSTDNISICPECGGAHIKEIGTGTQKVEEELKNRFKDIKVMRMDADTTVGRTTHEKLLSDFENGGADVLIGTQMVAKGLDFPNVSLVGVINCDNLLFSGDFRAATRTFSLIAQVVGRAGRRDVKGRAVVQTFSPDNPCIKSAALQDYSDFYDWEIKNREMLNLPPFNDIFVITLLGKEENDVLREALRMSATLHKAFSEKYKKYKTEIFGPTPPQIGKMNDKYKYNISFRGSDTKDLRELVSNLLVSFGTSGKTTKVTAYAEINPLNF